MDRTDIDIIVALLDHDSTVHELSKTLYKTTDQHALGKHNSFLRYRLGQLASEGLVRRYDDGSGRSIYRVPVEDMILGRARLVIDSGKGQTSLNLGQVLVTEKDGNRQILVLKW